VPDAVLEAVPEAVLDEVDDAVDDDCNKKKELDQILLNNFHYY
jgi:hypothetical protein